MELKGERLIPAPVDKTWAALNDPEVLRRCITGCESLERTADDSFLAQLAVRIGPVSARFKGHVQLRDMQPPHRYTLAFDGQGGVAGFGKGSADVSLQAAGAHTQLSYVARAPVGGKIAQIGSRLVDATAHKMADEFFSAFEAALSPPAEAGAAPAAEAQTAPAAPRVPAWAWWAAAAAVAVAVYLLTR